MITDTEQKTSESSPPTTARPNVGDGSNRAAEATVWRVNVRLLIWSLVIVAVVAPSLYFWREYQIRRHAVAIFDRAQALQENDDWRGAAAAYHQYLQIRPESAKDPLYPKALLRRAEAFSKQGVSRSQLQRAISFYFTALKANPEEEDARLRLAELLFRVERYEDAEAEARKVDKNVSAARLVVGALQKQLGPSRRVTRDKVIEAFRTALVDHPGDIPLSLGFADFLRRDRDALTKESGDAAASEADAVIDQMVSVHPDDPQALMGRYRYRTTYRIADADSDLRRAREVAPDDPDVLQASAIAAAGDTDHSTAKAYCKRLIEVAPKDPRSYLTASNLSLGWNEPNEAIAILRSGLSSVGPNDIGLNRRLLRMLLAEGKPEEVRPALQSFNAAIKLRQDEAVTRGRKVDTADRRRLDEESTVAAAQLDLLEGNPAAALPILKRMAASTTESANADETLAERQRRWRLLGLAYTQLSMPDQAATAFEELLRLDPTAIGDRLSTAAQWRAAGDVDRALRHYETLAEAQPAGVAGWVGLAETRIDQQLRRKVAEERDWTGVDAAVKRALALAPNAPPVVMAQARAALARNDREECLKSLRQLTSRDDLPTLLLPRIALLLDAAGAKDEADQLLERYRKSDQGALLADFSQVELLRRRGQTAEAIQMLVKDLAQSPGRFPILRLLIELEIDSGSMKSARQRLFELRTAKSDDLWVYETAADLALFSGDHRTDLVDCVAELKSLEGPSGTRWRFYEALRSLEEDRKGPQPDAREANRLLTEIDSLRPNWPQSRILRGRIAERTGKMTEAAEQYELALRSGARNLSTLQWLVAALYKQNRYADAAAYIRQLGRTSAVSGELSSQAIPANLQAGRIEEALRVARSASELRPNDPLAQIWYAQTLALDGKGKEAERYFRQAKDLDPKDIRTWSGLIWFFSRERRLDEARQTLEELVTKIEMTRVERELVLARGFDLIGDRSLAEKHFRDALAERPDDARLHEEVGRFYFKFDHEKSLDIHLKALKIDPKSSESRRAVALLWGLRGSEADWRKAIDLLEGEKETAKIDDRRLEITLLLMRGGNENVVKAAELASAMIRSEPKPNPIDRLLLAKANEDIGRLDEAQEQLAIVVKDHDQPTFLGTYVEFLIRHDRLDDVERWLARLEEKEPGGTRGLELRLKWLVRSRRTDEIEPLVDQFVAARMEAAKSEDQKTALLRYAADLLNRSERPEGAERKFRALMELVPAGYEAYALWMAEQGRIDEALTLCREKLPTVDFMRGVNAIVRILTVAESRGDAIASDADAIESILTSARQSDKADIQLLLELGVLRIMQKRDSEAIALYEQALAKDPKNVAVLNNLSLALVDIPDRRDQAIQYIDQAVASSPNSQELLDTRALVLIGVGRNGEAREILEGLCRANRKNPRYRLHLAIALHQLNEADESQRQIAQATEDGIQKELLTPSERKLLNRIAGDKSGPSTQ